MAQSIVTRITTAGLKCSHCSLYLLTHFYSHLQKIREETGKNYLMGECPSCTTPFRRELFDVEVVHRRVIFGDISGVGSSLKLFVEKKKEKIDKKGDK